VTGITDDARRERIEAVGFDYTTRSVRPVVRCNLCGAQRFVVLVHRDRYGYQAQAHACRQCGLVFLNPVMTADAYGEFYTGVYRPLVSAYHGRLIDAQTIQAEQRDYAHERGALLAPYVEQGRFTTLLDIGGSTGVVADAFVSRFGLRGTVLDPSPDELDEARTRGLETIGGLVEQYEPEARRFDVVVMCQTVDHLLDIARTLRAIRQLMHPDGVFFVDIVDFRAAYLRNWSVEEAVKIDHPHYLTATTFEVYLAQAGFAILCADYAADHLHVGYVCRPCSPRVDVLPSVSVVQRMFDEVRLVQNAPRPA